MDIESNSSFLLRNSEALLKQNNVIEEEEMIKNFSYYMKKSKYFI